MNIKPISQENLQRLDLQNGMLVHLLNSAPSPLSSLLFTCFISNKNISALKLRDVYASTTTAHACTVTEPKGFNMTEIPVSITYFPS